MAPRDYRGGKDDWVEHREFSGQWNYSVIPQWWIYAIAPLAKSIECVILRVHPNISSGLRMIRMCQWSKMIAKTCIVLQNFSDGGGCRFLRTEGISELPVLFTQFCCEPTSAL